MESGAIPNEQISASSEWNYDSGRFSANHSRLNFQGVDGKRGSWSAGRNDANQWLQIDLGTENFTITRVATQGRHDFNQWVTSYKLQYSNNEVNFTFYREQGKTEDKVKWTTFPFELASLGEC